MKKILEYIPLIAAVISAIYVINKALQDIHTYLRWYWEHPLHFALTFITLLAVGIFLFLIFIWRRLNEEVIKIKHFLTIITIYSFIVLLFLGSLPFQFPEVWEADVIHVCGSTTLGEFFAPRYIEAIALRNHASEIKTIRNSRISIQVEFNRSEDKTRVDKAFTDMSKIQFIVDSHGTEDGITELSKNNPECDVSMASSAAGSFRKDNANIISRTLGFDAVAIIANEKKMKDGESIDKDKLAAIFKNDKTTEKEWTVVYRKDSGTTRELEKYLGLPKDSIVNSSGSGKQEVKSNFEMLDKVAAIPNAIGYISFSYLGYKTNQIATLAVNNSKEPSQKEIPTFENIVNKQTQTIRRLYLYIRNSSTNSQDIKDKIAKILFDQAGEKIGQTAVRNSGFVPTNAYNQSTPPSTLPSGRDKLYTLVKNYEKQYVELGLKPLFTVKFELAEDMAISNKNGIIKFSQDHDPNDPLITIGFTDVIGDETFNKGLSLLRAESVGAILQEQKLKFEGAYGFGEVGQKGTDEESRRVEIYSLNQLKKL